MINPSKLERVFQANAVIWAISSYGRKFFYNKETGAVAHFIVDKRGKVWYIDDYQGSRIHVAYRGYWRGFSHGGTLKCLIEDLYGFIKTGEKVSANHFGPWPLWLQGGDRNKDRWGYGWEAMEAMRAELRKTGAVEEFTYDNATNH